MGIRLLGRRTADPTTSSVPRIEGRGLEKDNEGRTPLNWGKRFLATHPARPKPSSIALIEADESAMRAEMRLVGPFRFSPPLSSRCFIIRGVQVRRPETRAAHAKAARHNQQLKDGLLLDTMTRTWVDAACGTRDG
jgi:hypothetical protein